MSALFGETHRHHASGKTLTSRTVSTGPKISFLVQSASANLCERGRRAIQTVEIFIYSLVDTHIGCCSDDGRPHKVAFRIILNIRIPPVEQDLPALRCRRVDQALNATLCSRRNDGTTDWSADCFDSIGEPRRDTDTSVSGSNPFPTLRTLARSINSGSISRALPTVITFGTFSSLLDVMRAYRALTD